jgi:hypothetical protein
MGNTVSAAKDAYNGMTSCGCEGSRNTAEAKGMQSRSHENEILAFKSSLSDPSPKGSFSSRASLQQCVVCMKAPIGKVGDAAIIG